MKEEETYLSEAEAAEALRAGEERLLGALVSRLEEAVGGRLTTESMARLDGGQLTLLAYHIFRREMLEGGMVQLVYNGYGPFIFLNPFAKAMRLWGLHDFSNLIYAARRLYEKHREALTQERDDEDFMALYEQFDDLAEVDDAFVECEPQVTAYIAARVAQHFAEFNRKPA